MSELDEAAEGKSLQSPETVLRPSGVYECHHTCSSVLGASRRQVHMNAHLLSHVPLGLLFILFSTEIFFCRGKRVESCIQELNETCVNIAKGTGMFVLEII